MSAAVWVATAVVPGIEVSGGVLTFVWVSLLLGLVNAVLGPLLRLVALPRSRLMLGPVAVLVNGVLLTITSWLSTDLDVDSFGTAVLGAFVIAAVVTALELALRPVPDLPHHPPDTEGPEV